MVSVYYVSVYFSVTDMTFGSKIVGEELFSGYGNRFISSIIDACQ